MIRKNIIFIFIIMLLLIIGTLLLITNNRKKENNNKDLSYVNTLDSEYTYNMENISNPYIEELEDGQKENNSPELKKEKQFKQIEITNINFIYNPGNKMTTITANLNNIGTEEQIQEVVALKIIGQNGEEIATIDALIPNIKVGETKVLRCSATADLSNASNFEILEK